MQEKLKDIKVNDVITGVYLVKQSNIAVARNNNEYLNVTLIDKTGMISGKIWDVDRLNLPCESGQFVKATIQVTEYNGKLQANFLEDLVVVPKEELSQEEFGNLVPCIEENKGELYDNLVSKIKSFKNPIYKNMGLGILSQYENVLKRYPAAKSMHHDRVGGLLLHTVEVVQNVENIAKAYPELDTEFTVLAAILHDLAKTKEFSLTETGLVSDYSLEGELIGHINMGAMKFGIAAKKYGLDEERQLLLQHMILAHHCEKEFGSPVYPKTLEAYILHIADDLSAKTDMFKTALKNTSPGEQSDKVYGLHDVMVYKPKYQYAQTEPTTITLQAEEEETLGDDDTFVP